MASSSSSSAPGCGPISAAAPRAAEAVEPCGGSGAATGSQEVAVVVPLRPKFGVAREELVGGGYYEGHFRFSRREGHGLLVLSADGVERYEGQFRAEAPDGRGRKVWADGTIYQGQWRAGRKDGEGTLQEPSGRTYSGQWKDGKRHGFGKQVFDGQTRYEGRWHNGLQHGSGKYYDSLAGSVYDGHWYMGAHHGPGIFRGKDGHREKLSYNHGMLTHREVLPPPVEYAPLPGI